VGFATSEDRGVFHSVLHIYHILGKTYMKKAAFTKALPVFQWILKLVRKAGGSDSLCEHEFGMDEQIESKAAWAECLMQTGELDKAIQKFESTKCEIENEIVYENPR